MLFPALRGSQHKSTGGPLPILAKWTCTWASTVKWLAQEVTGLASLLTFLVACVKCRAFPTVHWTQYWAWNVNPVITPALKMKAYVIQRKHEDPTHFSLESQLLRKPLTPACSEESATKAFLRICQEHKSTWSLHDLKSILDPIHSSSIYIHQQIKVVASHTHSRTEKIFGKKHQRYYESRVLI